MAVDLLSSLSYTYGQFVTWRILYEKRSVYGHHQGPARHPFQAAPQILDQTGDPGRLSRAGKPPGLTAPHRGVRPQPARAAQRVTFRPQGSARRSQTLARTMRSAEPSNVLF